MLAIFTALSLSQPAPPIPSRATATVRVLVPGRSSKVDWEQSEKRRKAERIVEEPDGRKVLLRLVEFE